MTHVLIDTEILRALGMSLSFFAIMLIFITTGISFLIYKILVRKGKQILWMTVLINTWAVFIILALIYSPLNPNYNPIFLQYSLMYILTTLIGITIILFWLFLLPKLLRIFNKELLITAGIFASISILERLIFPFLNYEIYLELILRVTMIIPPLMGFFMIIKSYIGRRKGK